MTLQEELLAIEAQLWTGGPDVWHNHCDDSCLVAFAGMAGPMARDDIAGMADEGRWRDLATLLKGIVMLSEDAVLLTYEASAVRREEHTQQPAAHHAVVSSAYIRRPDGWKLAFHQHSDKQPAGIAPDAI